MIERTVRVVVSLATVLLVCGAVAVGQTPDGETPSGETTCDLLKDPQYTPGLYGLCVAFCEALDGETYDPLGVCNVAPTRILNNYNRLRGESDPSMPCLKPACPCFDLEDVLALQVDWCRIGSFDPNFGCFYVTEGWKYEASVMKISRTLSPWCYYKDKSAGVEITDEEALSCLAILAEARGAMACEERIMECRK